MSISLYVKNEYNLSIKSNYNDIINILNAPVVVNIPAILRIAKEAGYTEDFIKSEINRLRDLPGKLTAHEYYYYRLWESPAPETFAGREIRFGANDICNSYSWQATYSNKLLFHTIMKGADLPIPKIKALVHVLWTFPDAMSVTNSIELKQFLLNPNNYPLFAKPIFGSHGLGAIAAKGIEGNVIHLCDNTTMHIDDLIDSYPFGRGYIIQELLQPKQRFTDSSNIYTSRLLILNTTQGPVLHRGSVKISTGSNIADNFWLPGNILCAVDINTGLITRVIERGSYGLVYDPEYSTNLVGNNIEDWHKAVRLGIQAAAYFPGIRLQSWDIAMTDKGPVILELNGAGDFNLLQLGQRVGVYDEVFAQHLAECKAMQY